MTFNAVLEFENKIAEYYGSSFAVATDCCTHAIELCLRYKNISYAVCPKHTYISIPFTFQKLNLKWNFVDLKWQDFYYVTDNIIDSAVYWQEDSYIQNTMMCLSFQFQKHLSLGRGGAILIDNQKDYIELKKMSYDGRVPNQPWAEQKIASLGYHYYMTPETAEIGLNKLEEAKRTKPRKWSDIDYPDLSEMPIFQSSWVS